MYLNDNTWGLFHEWTSILEPQCLQRAKLRISWLLCFKAFVLSKKVLRRNNCSMAVIKGAVPQRIRYLFSKRRYFSPQH